MEQIGITTQKLIHAWGCRTQTAKKDFVLNILKKVLTKQEQKHIKIYSLKDSHAVLRIDSSAWLYTLHLKKRKMIEAINSALPIGEKAYTIHFKLDNQKQR